MYESTIAIKEKYGENCKLDECNIKNIYFMTDCNNSVNDYVITEYLEKHYTKEEILQWNDEYINAELDSCYRLLVNVDWESISTIGTKVYELCRVFTYNRGTYERIIEQNGTTGSILSGIRKNADTDDDFEPSTFAIVTHRISSGLIVAVFEVMFFISMFI